MARTAGETSRTVSRRCGSRYGRRWLRNQFEAALRKGPGSEPSRQPLLGSCWAVLIGLVGIFSQPLFGRAASPRLGPVQLAGTPVPRPRTPARRVLMGIVTVVLALSFAVSANSPDGDRINEEYIERYFYKIKTM